MSNASKVQKFRKAINQTQEQAADWWGCTVRSWQRYEAGERPVPKPLLNEIDRYYAEGIAHSPRPA